MTKSFTQKDKEIPLAYSELVKNFNRIRDYMRGCIRI